MFLSLVLVIVSGFLLSGCDNPAQKGNNTKGAESSITVPHKNQENIANYLSGHWNASGTFYKGSFSFNKATNKAKKAGFESYVRFFQRGSAEIISLSNTPDNDRGESYIITRQGSQNMTLSDIQTGKIPPDTLKIRKGPGRYTGVEPFEKASP